MTYEELMWEIKAMSEEQRECTVTVFVKGVGEYYPAESGVEYATETDILDEILDADHPFITI